MAVSRPTEVLRWSLDELSRIQAVFEDTVMVTAVDQGDALFTVRDPAGRGWVGTARLVEVRTEAQAIEFTVFFSASPPSRRRPRTHLWGIDIRDDGRQASLSMDTPWREIETDDGPALQTGIERLVSGDFQAPLLARLGARGVRPYGA